MLAEVNLQLWRKLRHKLTKSLRSGMVNELVPDLGGTDGASLVMIYNPPRSFA